MPEQKYFTQGHALLIGIGSDDLPNTVQDAMGLAEILRDVERCAYPVNQVTVLTKAEATREGVLAKLDELAAAVKSDSTLIFYFSGHGYEVDAGIMKEYFLIPHGHDDDDLTNTAISRSDLMTKLNAIDAQKQLILFDCCHASGLDDLAAKSMSTGIKVAKSPISQATIDELAKGNGRIVISSSKADELSYAGKPFSQFTQALLEGFAGEGASKLDGLVRAADLATYASKMVPHYTRNKQNPALNFSNADNFAVAYYAAGGETPKGLPKGMVRQPDPELDNTPTGTVTINQSGSGNMQVAGDKNVVAGERGVAVGGNVGGNIVTGNNARVINAKEYVESMEHNVFNQKGQTVQGDQSNVAGNVNTGGGAFIAGGVTASEFIGRDKVIHGDEVKGDKNMSDKVNGNQYKVGSISGGQVAMGDNAHIDVTNNPAPIEMISALQPIINAVQAAPAEQQAAASEKIEGLKQEIAKGEQAQDTVLAGLVQDLAELVPSAIQAIGSAFGSPLLSVLAGQATDFVLKRIGAKK